MYTIAKHATEKDWAFYWEHNPQLGIQPAYSAYYTRPGQEVGLKLMYETQEAAKTDLEKIKLLYPNGNYEICPLL